MTRLDMRPFSVKGMPWCAFNSETVFHIISQQLSAPERQLDYASDSLFSPGDAHVEFEVFPEAIAHMGDVGVIAQFSIDVDRLQDHYVARFSNLCCWKSVNQSIFTQKNFWTFCGNSVLP